MDQSDELTQEKLDQIYQEVELKTALLNKLLVENFSDRFCDLSFSEILEIIGADSNSLILDLGANIGQQIDESKSFGVIIHAFEPHPVIFNLLSQKYGNSKNVTLLNAAAGTDTGKFRLF